MGIQADVLGAHALEIRNILAMTGDPPRAGDYVNATAVFDVDAIGLDPHPRRHEPRARRDGQLDRRADGLLRRRRARPGGGRARPGDGAPPRQGGGRRAVGADAARLRPRGAGAVLRAPRGPPSRSWSASCRCTRRATPSSCTTRCRASPCPDAVRARHAGGGRPRAPRRGSRRPRPSRGGAGRHAGAYLMPSFGRFEVVAEVLDALQLIRWGDFYDCHRRRGCAPHPFRCALSRPISSPRVSSASTRSSPSSRPGCTSTAMPPPALPSSGTSRPARDASWDRSTACPSRSRTSTTPPGFVTTSGVGRLGARAVRPVDAVSVARVAGPREPSSWARSRRRRSRCATRRRHAIRGIPDTRRAVRRAARARRSARAWCRWRWARRPSARSCARPPTAALVGFKPTSRAHQRGRCDAAGVEPGPRGRALPLGRGRRAGARGPWPVTIPRTLTRRCCPWRITSPRWRRRRLPGSGVLAPGLIERAEAANATLDLEATPRGSSRCRRAGRRMRPHSPLSVRGSSRGGRHRPRARRRPPPSPRSLRAACGRVPEAYLGEAVQGRPRHPRSRGLHAPPRPAGASVQE